MSKVYEAISNVQNGLAKEGIQKEKTSSFGDKFKYRGIDDIYNALSRLMAENRLTMLPRVLSRVEACRNIASKDGPKTLYFAILEVEYDFVCTSDGTKHTIKVFGEAMDSGDKATIKAMSQAHKAACIQTFCIPTERDPDIAIREQEEEQKRIAAALEKEAKDAMDKVTDGESYKLARETIMPVILRMKSVAPDLAATYEAKMIALKEKHTTPRQASVSSAMDSRKGAAA